jgi:hypothetical protein
MVIWNHRDDLRKRGFCLLDDTDMDYKPRRRGNENPSTPRHGQDRMAWWRILSQQPETRYSEKAEF